MLSPTAQRAASLLQPSSPRSRSVRQPLDVHYARQSLHAVQTIVWPAKRPACLVLRCPRTRCRLRLGLTAAAAVPPQARHPSFGGPVVARAHALAAATLAPSDLTANAATAGILADLGLDGDTVAAALLADALDASPLTRPQLEVTSLLVVPYGADWTLPAVPCTALHLHLLARLSTPCHSVVISANAHVQLH